MYESEIMQSYPVRRVKAYDGMAVTAAVWDAAHDFHRSLLEVHTSFAHGFGVLHGLEVIAGEPADRQIYIQPGIAVDPLGRTIILSEQRAYDLRSVEGMIYIVLSFGESQPRNDAVQAGDDAPRFVYNEFGLEALVALPKTPYVELARIRRQGSGAAVRTAALPASPTTNEIDLRYRTTVGASQPKVVRMAVVTPTDKGTTQLQGAINLAGAVERSGFRLIVDGLPLDRAILDYDVVYLVGQGPWRLNGIQTGLLQEFHRQGGSIFYESERSSGADDKTDVSFREFITSLGVSLTPVAEDAPLLRTPNFFPTPPEGFETTGSPRLMATDGILFSGYDYGALWQGKRRGRVASRSEVRSAFEFGENLLTVAYARSKRA